MAVSNETTPPVLEENEPRRRSRSPLLRSTFWLAGAVGLAGILFWFPPDEYRFYPRCLLFTMTGIQCPGCGGLRAAHQLLHGHLASAFHFNALLVSLLPVAAWIVLASTVKAATGRDWLQPWRRPFWLWLLLAAVLAFMMARNWPGNVAHSSGFLVRADSSVLAV